MNNKDSGTSSIHPLARDWLSWHSKENRPPTTQPNQAPSYVTYSVIKRQRERIKARERKNSDDNFAEENGLYKVPVATKPILKDKNEKCTDPTRKLSGSDELITAGQSHDKKHLPPVTLKHQRLHNSRKRHRSAALSPDCQPAGKRRNDEIVSIIVSENEKSSPGPRRLNAETESLQERCSEREDTNSSPAVRSLSDVYVPRLCSRDVLIGTREDGSPDVLGEGSYGFVVRGILTKDQREDDIVSKYFRKNRSSMEEIIDEAKVLGYLEDTGAVPKVYGLMDTGREDQFPALVQECFGEGQTLDELLIDPPSKKTCFQICLEAAKGLQKIHDKHVLLNDIKPDNLLVDVKSDATDTPGIRFIDMGLATFNASFVSPNSEASMVNCPHMAPEVRKQQPSSVKSDIFSLGFLIELVGKAANVRELVALGCLLTFDDPSLRLELSTVICWLTSLVNHF